MEIRVLSEDIPTPTLSCELEQTHRVGDSNGQIGNPWPFWAHPIGKARIVLRDNGVIECPRRGSPPLFGDAFVSDSMAAHVTVRKFDRRQSDPWPSTMARQISRLLSGINRRNDGYWLRS